MTGMRLNGAIIVLAALLGFVNGLALASTPQASSRSGADVGRDEATATQG
jgi:hypothetical protein